jgi:hypothetical protein
MKTATAMRAALCCYLLAATALAGASALAQNAVPRASDAASAPPAAQATAPSPALPATAPSPAPPAAGQTLPPQPPAPGVAAATDAIAPVPEKPGFFDDLARWWHNSAADLNAKFKEQQSKLDDFNKKSAEAAKDAATATQQAMKNAADAMVRSATGKVIEVHAPCTVAANGAADCASAAVNACKGKGFADGQPLDVRTAEKCNASLWVQGQRQPPAECPVETVVLRAACQ